MANTVTKKIKVEELSKFGFKANGNYVNYSKLFKDQVKVVPGAEFEAELYVADSGKEYLNKIISTVLPAKVLAKEVLETAAEPKALPVVDAERAKKFTPKFQKKDDDAMTRADWDNKDRRISRQGAVQAAVHALAAVVSLEALPKEAFKLADQMLEYVNKAK